jgi:hypothetical protein
VTPTPAVGTRYVHGPGNATGVSVTNMTAKFTATVAGTYQVCSPSALPPLDPFIRVFGKPPPRNQTQRSSTIGS